jgi:translin
MDEISEIAERLRSALESAHQAREAALQASRAAIRFAANSIRATHRGEFETSEELLESARASVEQAKAACEQFPLIRYSGFISDAEKELAEACITLGLVRDSRLLPPEEVGVGVIEYLGGVAEAVGEMRRHLLDSLRRGDVARGETVLQIMDDLYQLLVSMDFPDALTRGLRSRTDAARGAVERSRSDLTITAIQHEIASTLEALHAANSKDEFGTNRSSDSPYTTNSGSA